MAIQRMEHIGVVVDDLDAAVEFFVALGLELEGEMSVEGAWVDRIVGLEDIQVDAAIVQTPDGQGKLELVKFNSPPAEGQTGAPANTRGIRHILFAVDDIDAAVASVEAQGGALIGEVVNYEEIYRLCYCSGPEGIIIELAERIG
jgi:catechol 2,3-dioxygenase-like lactoylglutathione lyase family enzyme